MDLKELQTVEAVSNVVKAELGWIFTQDSEYTEYIEFVRNMVGEVRTSEFATQTAANAGVKIKPNEASAVGGVPAAFIKKTIASKNAEEEDIHSLQVSIFAYTHGVYRHVSDVIPKLVHHFLVSSVSDGLVRWMLGKATREDLEIWFAEDSKSLRKRKEITHKLSQFQEGVKILDTARRME